MPILVKSDDVRNGEKGQGSSRAVTGGTGVNGLKAFLGIFGVSFSHLVPHMIDPATLQRF